MSLIPKTAAMSLTSQLPSTMEFITVGESGKIHEKALAEFTVLNMEILFVTKDDELASRNDGQMG